MMKKIFFLVAIFLMAGCESETNLLNEKINEMQVEIDSLTSKIQEQESRLEEKYAESIAKDKVIQDLEVELASAIVDTNIVITTTIYHGDEVGCTSFVIEHLDSLGRQTRLDLYLNNEFHGNWVYTYDEAGNRIDGTHYDASGEIIETINY